MLMFSYLLMINSFGKIFFAESVSVLMAFITENLLKVALSNAVTNNIKAFCKIQRKYSNLVDKDAWDRGMKLWIIIELSLFRKRDYFFKGDSDRDIVSSSFDTGRDW